MMRNRVVVLGFLVLVAALCGNQSLADDSAMSNIGGGVVAPMASHPSVRMMSETVSVRLTEKSAKVRCEFIFKNEGRKCMVKMGFPEESWASGEGSTGILYGFRSWVDGKSVKCVYKPSKEPERRDTYEVHVISWYVKDVPFEQGQVRKVVNEYSANLGISTTAGMTEYEEPRNFVYILRTGRNWKGLIGKAVITVDTSRVSPEHYELKPRPTGFVKDAKAISWTMTNFEPKDDILIALKPRYPKLNGKMINPYQWSPLDRVNGVTMVGTQFLHDLGVKWGHSDTPGDMVIIHNGHTLKLTTGSKTALLDGSKITLQAAPTPARNHPIQIPAASVVRALGGRAYYSQQEHRLILSLPKAVNVKH